MICPHEDSKLFTTCFLLLTFSYCVVICKRKISLHLEPASLIGNLYSSYIGFPFLSFDIETADRSLTIFLSLSGINIRDVGIESTLYFGNKTTVGAQLSYATARGFSHILIPDKDRNMVRLRSAVSISKDKNGKPIYEEYKFPISEAGSRCKEIFLLHITTQ